MAKRFGVATIDHEIVGNYMFARKESVEKFEFNASVLKSYEQMYVSLLDE